MSFTIVFYWFSDKVGLIKYYILIVTRCDSFCTACLKDMYTYIEIKLILELFTQNGLFNTFINNILSIICIVDSLCN